MIQMKGVNDLTVCTFSFMELLFKQQHLNFSWGVDSHKKSDGGDCLKF